MYYKVLKNNKVIDVLDNLIYLKWQPKHKIMVLTDESDAQAILSSDKNTVWHEQTLYNVPVNGYDTVKIEEIPFEVHEGSVILFDGHNYTADLTEEEARRKRIFEKQRNIFKNK